MRVEMPIYSNSQDNEVTKVVDFQKALQQMGLRKYVERSRFKSLIAHFKDEGLMATPELINTGAFFAYLREHGYDYAGRLLAPSYHQMSCKAHRVMNRFSRLMAIYASEQQNKSVTINQII